MSGWSVPWIATPFLFNPIQAMPDGFRGPGGILKKSPLRLPCLSIASSQRNQGNIVIRTTFQVPSGAGSVFEPGVIGVGSDDFVSIKARRSAGRRWSSDQADWKIGCGNIADNGVLNAVANPAAARDP